jgi:thioester reductase-like protein
MTGEICIVPELLCTAAHAWPERRAIIDSAGTISYRELRQLANGAACELRKRDIGPGARVALIVERTRWSAAAIYGIWAAGASVVLIDPSWPRPLIEQRLRFVDASLVTGPAVVDSAVPLASWLTPTPDPQPMATLAEDPAYIVFTSGTTGAPKAVEVHHGALSHYVAGVSQRLGLRSDRAPCFGHVTTLAADLGHTALFAPVAIGGGVAVISDAAVRDPEQFWRDASRLAIDWLKTTSSHFRALREWRPPNFRLRGVVLGGESLTAAFVRSIFADGAADVVANHYGPSEATIGVACHVMTSTADLPDDEYVPIGRAIGDMRLWLESHADDPAGSGELMIAGPQVARYFGRAERRDSSDARGFDTDRGVYRTCDICSEFSAGLFTFLHRRDRRVKIRGHTVDCGEIERVIAEIPGVSAAAVIVREVEGQEHLLGAFSASCADLAPGQVLRSVENRLPAAAIPRPLIRLESLPLNANGKVDYQQLAAKFHDSLASNAEPTSAAADPTTSLLPAICEQWSALLGVPVSADAVLTALGADSLQYMRLVARLRHSGIEISMHDAITATTPRLLAGRLALQKAPTNGAVSDQASTQRRLSTAQQRFFRRHLPNPDQWNQAVLLKPEGRTDPVLLARATEHIVLAHSLLRQAFENERPSFLSDAVRTCFGISTVDDSSRVESIAAAIQETISVSRGHLFHVQLIVGPPAMGDRILLVAHHLATDMVSWHILLDQLAAAYDSYLLGATPPRIHAGDFWACTRSDVSPPNPPRGVCRMPAESTTTGEGIGALVLVWERPMAALLRKRFATAHDLEAALACGILDGLEELLGTRRVTLDIEGHGRPHDGTDGALAVGWLTRTVAATMAAGQSLETVRQQIRDASELGPDDEAADILVNFLGRVEPVKLRNGIWSFAAEPLGTLRHPAGDADYKIKVTSRFVDGRLVVDIVHDRSRVTDTTVATIADGLERRLAAAMPRRIVWPSSTSGALTLSVDGPAIPPATATTLTVRVPTEAARPRVALSGATGFLGLHLLNTLIEGGARVAALVRGESPDLARRRLTDAYVWSFGKDAAARIREVEIVLTDLTAAEPDAAAIRACLGEAPSDIVHAAADTRLVAPEKELSDANVEAVRRMLRTAEALGSPSFHHVSTLAVAGLPPAGKIVDFSETDFDYGQTFATAYERTKFDAERLVRGWRSGPLRIFRMGHLAAHSDTGQFQRNIGDNRVYQTIRAMVMLGAAPVGQYRQKIAFSHVDIVARSIVEIIRSKPAASQAVYHLESPHDVPLLNVIDALKQADYPIVPLPDADFTVMLGRHAAESDDPSLLATLMWLQQPQRTVRYERDRSLRDLASLGIAFPPPGREWLRRLVDHATEVGFLPMPFSRAQEEGR